MMPMIYKPMCPDLVAMMPLICAFLVFLVSHGADAKCRDGRCRVAVIPMVRVLTARTMIFSSMPMVGVMTVRVFVALMEPPHTDADRSHSAL